MAKFNFRTSIKHIQIDKANSLMVVSIAAAAAIVVFTLVAGQALLKQRAYQSKVISLRSKANKQLESNIKASNALVASYKTFEDSSESIIGTASKNSVVVLDALPSKYDFPALATSLDGIITGAGAKVESISGTDNEAGAEQDSVTPKPVEMPFTVSASGNFATMQKLILDMERSIRPFQITSIKIGGDSSNLKADISAKTFYQPQKKLDIQQTLITNGKSTVKATTSNQGSTK